MKHVSVTNIRALFKLSVTNVYELINNERIWIWEWWHLSRGILFN